MKPPKYKLIISILIILILSITTNGWSDNRKLLLKKKAHKENPKGIYELIQDLDKDELTRKHAIRDLARRGEEAVEPLIEALRNNNRYIHDGAVQALVEIGEPAVESLREALESNQSVEAEGAAQALKVIDYTRKNAPQSLPSKKGGAQYYGSGIRNSTNNSYVGARKCKGCHKGDKKGNVYEDWLNTKHAKAFDLLKGDEQNDPQCLHCHTTGYGQTTKAKPEMLRGVQCEACHGPGSNYKKKKIMENLAFAKRNGLIIPNEKTCVRCHNKKSPHFKGFSWEKTWYKIKHVRSLDLVIYKQ